MTFTILGSGTHFPDPDRRSAGYLLRDGKQMFLFDFGYGTLLRLVELKVRYQDIKHIFFTHLHEDHYLDFLPFLISLYLQVAKWGLAKRTLHIHGPQGMKTKLTRVLNAMGIGYAPYVKLVFHVREVSTIHLGKLTIRSHPIFHMKSLHALCYRIERGKNTIAYTGDLDYDESIIPFLKGVQTLVIECGFPDQMKKSGHLTPSEAGRIAQAAGVKRVVLTHRYHPCDLVNIIGQCRREFTGRIGKARDGLTISPVS